MQQKTKINHANWDLRGLFSSFAASEPPLSLTMKFFTFVIFVISRFYLPDENRKHNKIINIYIFVIPI